MNRTTSTAFVIARATAMQNLIELRATHATNTSVTYRSGTPFVKHKYIIKIDTQNNATETYEISGDTKRELVDNSISFMQGFWCGQSSVSSALQNI